MNASPGGLQLLRLGGALVALLGFLGLSRAATAHYGFVGLWLLGFQDVGHLQILVDLMIACLFALLWMFRDARERGLNPWPFFLLLLPTGSLGLLSYLVWREAQPFISARTSPPESEPIGGKAPDDKG